MNHNPRPRNGTGVFAWSVVLTLFSLEGNGIIDIEKEPPENGWPYGISFVTATIGPGRLLFLSKMEPDFKGHQHKTD